MERELRITGVGKLSLKPDIAIISLPIESLCKQYAEAIDTLNKKVEVVHGILKKRNIERNSLKTTGFDIREEWKYYRSDKKKSELVGFKASHDLKLELPLDNVLISSVLSDLANSNAGITFRLRFDVSNKDKYDGDLIKDAVKNAKLSAEMIAASTGVKLKEIIKIDYSFSEVQFQETKYLFESNLMCEASPMPDFSPDEIEVKKNITLIWRIE